MPSSKSGRGTFHETLTVTKPVTLQGAGWDKTVIAPGRGPQDRENERSTLVFNKVRGASIKGMKISIKLSDDLPQIPKIFNLVTLYEAEVSIANCAIVGPAANGIIVARGSTMRMEKSLVAGLWETGISCFGDHRPKVPYPASRIKVVNSVIRSCHTQGIRIGPGCDTSRVERSWISGSAWYGIRYDSASPRIENNYITGNAQAGIHASGPTEAMVRGNAIIDNESAGMMCVFKNTDRIEDNVIRQRGGHSLMIMGSSKPEVSGNRFIQNQGTMIACYKYETDQVLGSPQLEKNRFIGNASAHSKGETGIPLPEGNTHIAKFPDNHSLVSLKDLVWPKGPLSKSYLTLSPDEVSEWSNLRIEGELWPKLLAEEKKIVPDGPGRSHRLWKTR